ncbi:hypothetical protein ACQKGC_14170, partial [Allorhizobium pseudoryzae]|uniref:hypothetical protein n=1 Tax=Allorhizobium pseudoryzae TaxID=379684 RepID=UPI003D0454AD
SPKSTTKTPPERAPQKQENLPRKNGGFVSGLECLRFALRERQAFRPPRHTMSLPFERPV